MYVFTAIKVAEFAFEYYTAYLARDPHNAINLASISRSDSLGFMLLQGSCAADKFALDHEATVKYETDFIKLDQFSLCMWARFTKHDGDHVLFTYSGELASCLPDH